jgi:hypothetical protein
MLHKQNKQSGMYFSTQIFSRKLNVHEKVRKINLCKPMKKIQKRGFTITCIFNSKIEHSLKNLKKLIMI